MEIKNSFTLQNVELVSITEGRLLVRVQIRYCNSGSEIATLSLLRISTTIAFVGEAWAVKIFGSQRLVELLAQILR